MPLQSFFYNEPAKQALLTMAQSGRLPHALLIEGREGAGKTHFARLAAAAALCLGEPKPCGTCKACAKVLADIHPDVELYTGSGASRSFHIEAVREIRAGAHILPTEGEKRIYILKNAQNMTVQAQNALLKLIEEPPAHTMFILTAPSRHALLPTIVSRVAVISLQPITAQECLAAIQKLRPGLPMADYTAAAEEAQGSIGTALSYLDMPKRLTIRLDAYDAAEQLAKGSRLGLLHIFARYERDRQDILLLFDALNSVMNEVFLIENGASQPQNRIKVFSGRFTALQAFKSADIIKDTAQQISQNGNISLLCANLCARLIAAAG